MKIYYDPETKNTDEFWDNFHLLDEAVTAIKNAAFAGSPYAFYDILDTRVMMEIQRMAGRGKCPIVEVEED